MELSEAKETLKNIKRCCFDDEQYQKYGFMEQYIDISDVEAIDTALKALDKYEKQLDLDYVDKNYVPKEKVREKIRWYGEFLEKNKTQISKMNLYMCYSDKKEALQELLGE